MKFVVYNSLFLFSSILRAARKGRQESAEVMLTIFGCQYLAFFYFSQRTAYLGTATTENMGIKSNSNFNFTEKPDKKIFYQ
jgi:hypothetical protein